MKPLATPVIGGMVSSLLHILIVTPILFVLIRERQFKKTANPAHSSLNPPIQPSNSLEPVIAACCLIFQGAGFTT